MGHLSISSSELNPARSADVPPKAPSSAFSSSSSSSPSEMWLKYMVNALDRQHFLKIQRHKMKLEAESDFVLYV